jgi:hypothetical protein
VAFRQLEATLHQRLDRIEVLHDQLLPVVVRAFDRECRIDARLLSRLIARCVARSRVHVEQHGHVLLDIDAGIGLDD